MLDFWTPVCIFPSSAYLSQTHCISVDQWSRWLSYWTAQSSPRLSIGLHLFFRSPLWNSHSSVGEFPSVGPCVVLSYFLVFVQVSPWSRLHHLSYPTWLIPTYKSPKLILLGGKKKKLLGRKNFSSALLGLWLGGTWEFKLTKDRLAGERTDFIYMCCTDTWEGLVMSISKEWLKSGAYNIPNLVGKMEWGVKTYVGKNK